MRYTLTAAAALFLSAAAWASDRPVMVELFTSQGCMSCPPADRFMEELTAQPGVIALTLNVDIWDYLGWRDTFAKRAFSLRQQAYAPLMPSRSVYTPQMVVGGSADVVGSRRADALALIKTVEAVDAPGADVALALNGAMLAVDIPANADLQGVKATVWVARVLTKREVNIGDGENRGKVITYHNVVRDLAEAGPWNSETAAHFDINTQVNLGETYDRIAVFVQRDGQGPILGAAMVDVPLP